MKVGDLIKLLAQYDLELDVWMSSDPEGNTYSPLSMVEAHRQQDGEMYGVSVNEEDPDKVVVLYP